MKITKELEVGDCVVLRSNLNATETIKMTVTRVIDIYAEVAYLYNGVIVKEELPVGALVAVEM